MYRPDFSPVTGYPSHFDWPDEYFFGPKPMAEPDIQQSGPLSGEVYVGWLDPRYPYSEGTVPEDFPGILNEVLECSLVAETLGWHECEFCPKNQGTGDEGGFPAFGSWEARIETSGVAFHVPALIVHYIEKHNYQPPLPFIHAVSVARKKRRPQAAMTERLFIVRSRLSYAWSVLTRAGERRRRSYLDQAATDLLKHVRGAFAEVPRPEPTNIWLSAPEDERTKTFFETFQGQSLTVETSRRHSAGLMFLNKDALQYFLPIFVQTAIVEPKEVGELALASLAVFGRADAEAFVQGLSVSQRLVLIRFFELLYDLHLDTFQEMPSEKITTDAPHAQGLVETGRTARSRGLRDGSR